MLGKNLPIFIGSGSRVFGVANLEKEIISVLSEGHSFVMSGHIKIMNGKKEVISISLSTVSKEENG